jgi:hypothetical protein
VNYIENILNDAYLSQNPFIFVLSKSLSKFTSEPAFEIMPDEIPTGSEVNKYAYAHFYLLCQNHGIALLFGCTRNDGSAF